MTGMPKPKQYHDIKYLASLAKLDVSGEEAKRITREIEQLVSLVEKLLSAEVDEYEPLYHPVVGKIGALREDEAKPGLGQGEALMNAAGTEKGFFVAPRTIED